MKQFKLKPGGVLRGSIRVPGDKSISHRSVILGSLAAGKSKVSGFLQGEDSLNTLRAFQKMGVSIEKDGDRLSIEGVGLHGLRAPDSELDLGNSGTAMRLMCGVLAGQAFDATLVGDSSLSSRPMKRVTAPLAEMGARIDTVDGHAPLKINGGASMQGVHYDMPMASAQVKSCLLLAGLYAEGETVVTEPGITRDHTERMLRGFGVEVQTEGNRISLKSGQSLSACDIDVPGDISSAAFFLVGASIAPGSDLTLEHVGMNPTRTGVIEILQLMGANIEVQNEREVGGEPVADLRVQSARLQGIAIPERLVPLAIDEFPVLFVAAACAEGETLLTGAEELRVKESDRIQVMADGLQSLGIDAQPTDEGMRIQPGQMQSASGVNSHGDHRIAMAFSMAALRAQGEISIDNCDNVNTSFPGFVDLARSVGLEIESP